MNTRNERRRTAGRMIRSKATVAAILEATGLHRKEVFCMMRRAKKKAFKVLVSERTVAA